MEDDIFDHAAQVEHAKERRKRQWRTAYRKKKIPKTERFPWRLDDELELLKDACQRDFWSFFLIAFGAGSNPKGQRWIEPKIHEPIARWLQEHADEWLKARKHGKGEQKHLAMVIHREVGKTTLMLAFQLWLHLRDPELSSYTGGEKTELAMKSLESMKAVLDGSDPYSMWSRLYGNWVGSRKWTGKEVTHAGRKNISRRDPSLGTFGVETSIVGAHPDAIFYDDPISIERLSTDADWLSTVNNQVSALFPVIQSDGLILWCGTRYSDEDHFGVAFRNEGIKTLSGMKSDMLVPSEDGKWHVYFMAGKDQQGVPSTPKVWSKNRMDHLQKRDAILFAGQVMNDPTLSETNPITKEQLLQCVVKSADVPWNSLRFAICCDTAFLDGDKIADKDETVFIIHGYPRNGSGDVYVIEGHGSFSWRGEDFAKRLVSKVQQYRRQGRRVFRITDEKTKSGKAGTWGPNLANYFADANEPFPGGGLLEFNRGNTKKESRLISAANYWVDGHVRIVEGAPGYERLMEQMGKIGQYCVNKRIKIDWADAHSDAFAAELYQPMRRAGPQAAPWDKESRMLEGDGFERNMFLDEEERGWTVGNPRPPLR